MEVNPLERDHDLSVVLPGGVEKNATVHGSKPVMDLLVTLCASYHLNPSEHAIEFLSPNKNNISFKPNSPIGSLEAEKIVLKPKGVEEKIRRPYMPEASVRLLINYNKSHKAVVRVSPRVPLEMLLPSVCDKCEFRTESTVLLRDAESKEALDLRKSLDDHGLREVYAKDTSDAQPGDDRHRPSHETGVASTSPPPPETPKSEQKEKKNSGFLSLFRRRKKKPEKEGSPGLHQQTGMNGQDDAPKKRRAPQPPRGASQSLSSDLSCCHQGGAQTSADSTLRSTKRRAPPPPSANTHQPDDEVKGTPDPPAAVEKVRESDESDPVTLSPSSSPRPSQPWSSSSSSRCSLAHLQEMADAHLPSFGGKDFSDARAALAKVLNSSVSKGALVKRLRNSATFPKFYQDGSSFRPAAQKSSGNGVFCAALEPFSKSGLPTESGWEDPGERKGMTTFRVVPSKKHPELRLELPDPMTVHPTEGSPDDPRSPDGSEASLQSPETPTPERPASPLPPDDSDDPVHAGSPLSQSVDTNQQEVTPEATPAVQSDSREGEPPPDDHMISEDQSESCQTSSSGTDEEEAAQPDEEKEEDANGFPPPPSPVFFQDDAEEETEDAAASVLPPHQPPGPPCEERTRNEEASDQPPPKPQVNTSAAPSRFAQAVALAVQRSRLQNRKKGSGPQNGGGPQNSLPSPPRTTSQIANHSEASTHRPDEPETFTFPPPFLLLIPRSTRGGGGGGGGGRRNEKDELPVDDGRAPPCHTAVVMENAIIHPKGGREGKRDADAGEKTSSCLKP
ncbi:cordon-bleu protein-like 1 [Antennarius striatus]|uniref:cordon-bleu protein-like 1 n=1 Tax=Antennarius striatus TaxID=241820 RepID=UPI0035B269E5